LRASTVLGIREFAADTQLTNVAKRNVLVNGKIANDRVSAPASQFEIVRFSASLISESFYFDDKVVHVTGVRHSLIEGLLSLRRQNALANLEEDLRRVRQSVVVQIL